MPDIKSIESTLALIKNDKSKILELTVGGKKVTPGQKIPKAEAQSAPLLSFPSANPTSTYIVIGLDIDAPFPSFTALGPILHWIQSDLKASPSDSSLTSSTPFVANYIGPAPPPPSFPHRYVFLIYEQPKGFEAGKYAPPGGKNLSNWNRMRFDLGKWEREMGMGSVVAGNYFLSN